MLYKVITGILIVLPLTFAAGWSIFPSVMMVKAVRELPPVYLPADETDNPILNTAVRRDIQKHFRKSGIYMPTEDILITNEENGTPIELITNACGKGHVFIWAPLRLRLPFFGERIIEICFKVKTKKT